MSPWKARSVNMDDSDVSQNFCPFFTFFYFPTFLTTFHLSHTLILIFLPLCFFSFRLCFVTTCTFPTSHSHHLLSLSFLYISSWLPAWFLLTMYRSFLHPMATNRALMVSLLPHHKRLSMMKRTCWMIELYNQKNLLKQASILHAYIVPKWCMSLTLKPRAKTPFKCCTYLKWHDYHIALNFRGNKFLRIAVLDFSNLLSKLNRMHAANKMYYGGGIQA